MSVRRHVELAELLDQRLAQKAVRLKEEVEKLNARRQEMLREAMRAEVAAKIARWILSPGLQRPK